VHHREHPKGFRWLHESFGTNWRMTEMQATIGRRQLEKLPDWIARRRRNGRILSEGMASVPGLRVPRVPEGFEHAYYKLYVFLEPSALGAGWNQAAIIDAINAEGIPCMAGSCSEIYRERAFVEAGFAPSGPLPGARQLSDTSLMFLVHPTLGDEEMTDTVAAVAKVMKAATGR
jgi:dTDP-4-amino-4,6-dideoxygalactose transaminase